MNSNKRLKWVSFLIIILNIFLLTACQTYTNITTQKTNFSEIKNPNIKGIPGTAEIYLIRLFKVPCFIDCATIPSSSKKLSSTINPSKIYDLRFLPNNPLNFNCYGIKPGRYRFINTLYSEDRGGLFSTPVKPISSDVLEFNALANHKYYIAIEYGRDSWNNNPYANVFFVSEKAGKSYIANSIKEVQGYDANSIRENQTRDAQNQAIVFPIVNHCKLLH